MNWRIIKSLVIKDLLLFIRDKFFGIMTIIGLISYIIFYLVMPNTVDEKIEIGLYSSQPVNLFEKFEEEGLILKNVETDSALKQAIIDKDFHIGISIPDDIKKTFLSGERPKLYVYLVSDLPEEFKDLYLIFMEELIHMASGTKLNIDGVDIVLGPDMGGKQIPARDRMLPLIIFFLLLMETLGLANLITAETEGGTIDALLSTPMNIIDLFTGKGITGILLAFSQTLIFMVVVGCLSHNAPLILTTVLLGSVMATALAFFIASISKDMMSVVAWGSLVMGILMLPAISILIPGPVSVWIKTIPSYYLVDVLHKVINFNVGWGGNLNNLLIIAGFNVAFIFLGIITLKRKIL